MPPEASTDAELAERTRNVPSGRRGRKVAYALAGLAALLGLALALLPARAATSVAQRIDGLALLAAEGPWWNGEADVVYRGIHAGRLAWRVRWPALLAAKLRADWRLVRGDDALQGHLQRGLNATEFTAAGRVEAASLNPLLAAYDIHIDGAFTVVRFALSSSAAATDWDGALRWTGGVTTYRLSDRTTQVALPPMTARLGAEQGDPVLRVADADDQTLLLTMRLRDEGWLHAEITKRFIDLAGEPWPGAAPDDAVIITVERQLRLPPR